MVGGHLRVAQTLGQQVGDALRLAAGVDEHQRRAVGLDQFGDPVQDLGGLLGRRDGLQLAGRHLQRQVQLPPVTHVDDHRRGRLHRAAAGAGAWGCGAFFGPGRGVGAVRVGGTTTGVVAAEQQPLDRADRPLCGRQADPKGSLLADVLEALQAEGKVRAALIAGHGVNLVDDHPPGGAQHLPAALSGEEEVQRFRGGDDEVGWVAQHGRPRRLRGVARAHPHPQRRRLVSHVLGDLLNFPEWSGEVLGDVGCKGLERRDVDHLRATCNRFASLVGTPEGVDGNQEGRQGLARSGGGADQRVGAGANRGPGAGLGGGGSGGEAVVEPGPHRRMEVGEDAARSRIRSARCGFDGGHVGFAPPPDPGHGHPAGCRPPLSQFRTIVRIRLARLAARQANDRRESPSTAVPGGAGRRWYGARRWRGMHRRR